TNASRGTHRDWEAAMLAQSLPLVIPPAPKVHAKDLPVWRHLLLAQRNSIGIFPDYAFDVPFARRTLLGVKRRPHQRSGRHPPCDGDEREQLCPPEDDAAGPAPLAGPRHFFV